MIGRDRHQRVVIAAAFSVLLPRTDPAAAGMRAGDDGDASVGDALECSRARPAATAIIPWMAAATRQTPRGTGSSAEVEPILWSVQEARTLNQLARRWNIARRQLRELNPDLDPRRTLPPGTRVRIHAGTTGPSARSIGAPNRGRLLHGLPLPEGESWTMKPNRRRVYGTVETIRALRATLVAYGEHFDDAPPIPIHDLSARRGGPIAPHKSHQSGRDVDIGFVLRPGPAGARHVDAQTFDAERNWFVVRTLIDRGDVQSIFTSGNAKQWLRTAAAQELSEAELAPYFDRISYEPGHRHHMHIRFRCPDAQPTCIDRST